MRPYWEEVGPIMLGLKVHVNGLDLILRAMRSHQKIFKPGVGVIIFEMNTLTTV